MITLKEDKLYISKDDAMYAEGTFVDFARSIKRYITSEQMKGRFAGWDVEHYTVPEIDKTTKEIRTDSFALVFTKNGNNMFYIETLLKPDYFTTTITCPILKIMNEPVAHCNGNANELFYNGGFNSHIGFGSMLSNYIRPTMKDVDAEFGTFSESKRSNGVCKMIKPIIEDYLEDYPYWRSVTVAIVDKQLVIDGIHELGIDWKLGHEDGNGRIGMKIYGEQKDLADLADYVDSRKGKTESFRRKIVRESTSKKIPYDLVSSFVILRDYANLDDDYINEEHRMLVDVADSIYNADISVSDMSKKYQDIYKKYGKSYFDKVLRDIRALDTQATSDNINDLIDEVNDKLSNFS